MAMATGDGVIALWQFDAGEAALTDVLAYLKEHGKDDTTAREIEQASFVKENLHTRAAIRKAIARVVPGYAELGNIDEAQQEFQIAGRTFHEPTFNTPSGKIRASVPRTTSWQPAPGEYRLMTLRSEGQFNTVVYEEEDLYRGTTRRDVVMMSQEDADRLELSEGDAVTVSTECGSMDVHAAIVDIRTGNLAMYFPEANVLVPRQIDNASGTPAFKSVIARLIKHVADPHQ